MAMLVAVTCLARRRRMHCDAAAAAAAMELEQMQCPPHDDQGHHRWPAEHGLPPDRRRRASSGRPGRGRWILHGGAPASLPPDYGQRRRRRQTAEGAPAGNEPAPDPAEEAPAAAVASEESEEAPAGGDAGGEAEAASASSPSSEASSASLVLCAVCLEEVRRRRGRGRGGGEEAEARTTTLPCSHSYHPGCVMPWLAAHGDCPCCRAAVPSPGESSTLKRSMGV